MSPAPQTIQGGGRSRGRTPLPEPPQPLAAPQHIWDTPGAFKAVCGERRKARLSSWPEMKGKLSLGGWNELALLGSGAAGAHFLLPFHRDSRHIPERAPGCPRGSRDAPGAGGMRGSGTGREKLLQDQPGAGERLPGGCERQIFLISSQEILFRLKGV